MPSAGGSRPLIGAILCCFAICSPVSISDRFKLKSSQISPYLRPSKLRARGCQIADATLASNSLKQTVHAHCAFVHKAAKLVAARLRVAGVTAGLAESNGSQSINHFFINT